ncbi:Carboxylic acid transporter protein [Purpureocillium lavendulum]|uniref:Carboxylic acid transporter protein n=1 Tax=Purpureocillium lavendulum TaxID=1247861 RepID=A0AB34FV33_9HYPO|nr:Carboxylic acid transporter protein [Purpureocillium lavendulum]
MLSLLTSLLLAGSALAAPTANANANTCTSKSTKVHEWTVHDFDFHSSEVFTTPAHQNSWGYVNFTLSNPVVAYRPVCSASSNQLSDFFYGNFVYKCNVPAQGDAASFTFARPTNELKVNQTWNCPGEGSRFDARGGVNLNLTCTTSTWQNPNWTPGSIYSTRNVDCKKVTVKVPIKEMSGVA